MLRHSLFCAALLLLGAAAARADEKATLVVRLPADAILLVGTTQTKQTGTERTFESPPLTTGQTYQYTLKASWTENGQPRQVTRKVEIKPGDRLVVDLSAIEATAPKTNPPQPDAPKPVPVPVPVKADPPDASRTAGVPKARAFEFTYKVTVTGLPADKTARVWMPVPGSNEDQDVHVVATSLPPGNRLGREPLYGNQMFYAEVKPGADGSATVSATYHVTRREVVGESKAEDAAPASRYLQPDIKVPVGGKSLELIKGKTVPKDQMSAARVLYDAVNNHMRYSKEGVGWGNGDAEWACESKYGNCTDFHSLFISLARSQKIPAKFEIGFPLPEKRGQGEVAGYHCWAKFKPAGKSWVPVDISEANKNPVLREYYFGNLTEDRVTFTSGRDFDLVPKQAGPPLNFFIYPHVEVDGQTYPAGKVQRKFTFKDEGK